MLKWVYTTCISMYIFSNIAKRAGVEKGGKTVAIIRFCIYFVWKNYITDNLFKGAMCKIWEDLLTEMQYNIHNYVFSGV